MGKFGETSHVNALFTFSWSVAPFTVSVFIGTVTKFETPEKG